MTTHFRSECRDKRSLITNTLTDMTHCVQYSIPRWFPHKSPTHIQCACMCLHTHTQCPNKKKLLVYEYDTRTMTRVNGWLYSNDMALWMPLSPLDNALEVRDPNCLRNARACVCMRPQKPNQLGFHSGPYKRERYDISEIGTHRYEHYKIIQYSITICKSCTSIPIRMHSWQEHNRSLVM